jgi:hypothetical protein
MRADGGLLDGAGGVEVIGRGETGARWVRDEGRR